MWLMFEQNKGSDMASISVTMINNTDGATTASLVLEEKDAIRAFNALRAEFGLDVVLNPDETVGLKDHEVVQLRRKKSLETNQEVMESFLEAMVSWVNDKTRNHEIMGHYKKLLEDYKPIF